MTNYYYIIFGSPLDYYKVCYNDLMGLDNVMYDCGTIHAKKWQQMLYRLHNSEKINNIVKIPRKNIWYNKMVETSTDLPICFIFFTNTKKFENVNDGLIGYLKKTYPNSKYVCIYQDIIALKRKVSLDKVKEEFDIIISYDQNDCERYGLTYYPDVYSRCDISDAIIDTDVYFIGRAKDRLNQIYQTYDRLEKIGCVCKFKLIDVEIKERRERKGIQYFDENITYHEVLKDVNRSHAILEIMQGGAVGYTLRTCEAIIYDKLLITDNDDVKSAPFYDQKNIYCLSDKNTELSLKDIRSKHIFPENEKEQLSPIKLLEFIQKQLDTGVITKF